MRKQREAVEECVLVVRGDGTLVGLYSDQVPWTAFGEIVEAPRASHVEFDVTHQEWTARDARTEVEIARGASRDAVLAIERDHYLQALRAGVAV